jgi:hypothetical protein
MKNFTLLFTLLFLAFAVVAQNNTNMLAKKYQDPSVVVVPQTAAIAAPVATKGMLTEGFEGATFPPAGWKLIDQDGDMNNWMSYEVGAPHSGTKSAASASWTASAGPLSPENYLVTPPLTVVAGDNISWWVAPQDPSYPEDKYAVMVSTTGNAAANFTTKLFEESLTAADSSWVSRTQSLSAYAGQTIYIAFKHYDCTDFFMMKLDDVTGPSFTVGMENANKEDNTVSVYPNPANNVLNVRSANRVIGVRVFNILGQTVISTNPSATHAVIDLSTIDTGMYFVEVETVMGTKTQKVNITR